jgi:hypothetical protein
MHTMGPGLPCPNRGRLEVGQGANGWGLPVSRGKEREGERKWVGLELGRKRREKSERGEVRLGRRK